MASEQEYHISGNERRGTVLLPDWEPEGDPACPVCRARGHLGSLYPLVDGRQMCSCCWSIFVPVTPVTEREEATDGK